MKRRAVLSLVAVAATAGAGLSPAFATSGKAKPKPKPLKGSWSFADYTPDATTTAIAQDPSGPGDTYCHGQLPAGPMDKNSYQLKITRKGTLEVVGSNTLDWAMEIDNAKGVMLAGSDGGSPTDEEGLLVPLQKPGTYTVTYCNLTGAPTATATYTFTAR